MRYKKEIQRQNYPNQGQNNPPNDELPLAENDELQDRHDSPESRGAAMSDNNIASGAKVSNKGQQNRT